MTNSSDEYWDIDGVSLNQYGWSVKDIGAGLAIPQHRGENTTTAYRPGQRHVAKVADARTISLAMWMTGTPPGLEYNSTTLDSAVVWNDNWDTIRGLAYRANSTEMALTRRIYRVVAGAPSLVSATAQAEFVGSLQPSMTGRDRCDFAMEFLLADPFFYGANITTNYAATGSAVINNLGDDTAWHENMTVTFTGPWVNPRFTNSTAGVYVQYTGTLAGGEVLTLDVGEFTAVSSVIGNAIGKIVHAGDRAWLTLLPGNNTVALSATSGSGSASIVFKPPYV